MLLFLLTACRSEGSTSLTDLDAQVVALTAQADEQMLRTRYGSL